MSAGAIVMHLLGFSHGLAAALVSAAVFSVAGLMLLPRRWAASIGGPGPAFIGASLYVLLCWVAISSRNIPLIDVALVFVTALCVVAAVRFRWLQSVLRARALHPSTRRWAGSFCLLYGLAYILARPPAPDRYLPLAPAGNLDLVTYARYARHVLEFGTHDLNLAAFEYLRSPGSTYLLAWQSLFFGRDPLTASMPTLFAVTALFGTIVAGMARSVFGLSYRASMAIACITITGTLFRWVMAGYALPTALAASLILSLLAGVCVMAFKREAEGPQLPGMATAFVLLSFVEPLSFSWAIGTLRASGRLLVDVSPVVLLGWPGRITQIGGSDAALAASFVLPLIAFAMAGLAYGLHRSGALDRMPRSDVDRRLSKALPAYAAIALVVGNVAIGAVRDRDPVRVTAAWRNLEEVNQQPFRSLTLKMDEPAVSLSTALALYFLPTKRAQVIDAQVRVGQLPYDAVSRQQPLFLHRFGCQVVGHTDVVEVRGIGCLVLSPPGMVIGTPYPFNRVFLFMTYDGMTAREPGGRWNTRPTLSLKVTSDPGRAILDREMYVNFFVNPFLPAGVKPQRLVFKWGKDRRGETSVGEEVWFSLPVRSEDWAGNRLWTLPIDIDFPDGRTILFHELSLTETPRGALVIASGT
jgi:hypothetical protein